MLINPARFQGAMEQMAGVGATPGGGVNRLALSDADKAARDLFARWAEEAGLSVRIDTMGNMFARREGENPGASPALAGSHLDSVPGGGRFDGSLGVLAGLEAVRTLNDKGLSTRRPIEIVNWTDEEGARFPPSMLGSGVFAGAISEKSAYETTDAEGVRFIDELERIGYRGTLPCAPRPIASYLELHIEQGPVLESEREQIGIVEGIFGLSWLRVTMTGERDHAGPTPMRMRRDALVGAARAIAALREIPARLDPDFVITVGEVSVSPNAINVIPGVVTFSVDFRHSRPEVLEDALRLVREIAREEAERENLALEIEEIGASSPIGFNAEVGRIIEAGCAGPGYSHRRIWSAAGHDARYMGDLAPTGMIFIPCAGGRSHSEDEEADWEDVCRGCDILAQTLIELANRE